MKNKVIAYDLGTGGVKASIYDIEGKELANSFIGYDTYYPHNGWHEQKPEEWWNAIVESTRKLLEVSKVDKEEIVSLAISGHSLGVIPIGKQGELLREATPIWSDSRADKEAKEFFKDVDYKEWYNNTGAGFPAQLYSLFKIMWYKNNEKEMYENIDKIIGTKDYINYKMTGVLCTDHSYASGSGAYSLKNAKYVDEYIEKAGIDKSIFPTILKSTDVVGTLKEEVAELLGLSKETKVICGGVDNSCMALGAKGIKNGRAYTSLGSSAWIAVISDTPIVDFDIKSYVFAHVIPGMYTSATAIFSAGTSHKWVLDKIVESKDKNEGYKVFDELASKSPVGANKLLFNPSLAGGSGLDKSPNIRGAFVGLDLKHTKNDMARATLEGISLNLRLALDALKSVSSIGDEMLMVGGGTKSTLWMQIFADAYKLKVIETVVGQSAGSLGAAALAAVGVGLWKDFSIIDKIHEVIQEKNMKEENSEKYDTILPIFKESGEYLSKIGDLLNEI